MSAYGNSTRIERMRSRSPGLLAHARNAVLVATVGLLVGVFNGTPTPARAAAGPLDAGTASVLSDDIGFYHFCDADCDVSLERCYRVDSLRIDCIVALSTGDGDPYYYVIATALVGNVLQFGEYSIPGHPRITRSLIRRWPRGFNTRPIAHWYAHSTWGGYRVFYPNRLARRHVGYGAPRLASVIRAQCRLQSGLHCSWRR
jgi:hypothetical protein